MSSPTAFLPPVMDVYPERVRQPASGLDYAFHRRLARLWTSQSSRLRGYRRTADTILSKQAGFAERSETELRDLVADLRRELRTRGLCEETVTDGFALVREAARRTTGQEHFHAQIVAGLVMLDGAIAEMQTGEGKTLAVTMPAGLMALAGVPVHVITVNDYLVHRDAVALEPIYRFLGLAVGEIISTSSPGERQRAYRCDVTYCANNEIVFDYLRDRLLLGDRASAAHLQFESVYGGRSRTRRLYLGGLRFAIIDEADSVLVDETRTPLILSAPGKDPGRAEVVTAALGLAQSLTRHEDYSVDRLRHAIELTPSGSNRIAALSTLQDGVWRSRRLREQLVKQALAATNLYKRDRHYVVRDGRVLIVDHHTGRIMPGRTWSEGMHQFVEAKEDCEITPEPATLARVSYQSFFRRYLGLAGMTGTAREVAGELWSVYGLRVVSIPPRLPCRRRCLGTATLGTTAEKWQSVVAAVARTHSEGRPVLVGTSSVAASEELSEMLEAAKLPHVVLNAKQDHHEAEIIACAGQGGRITVATNMAGRGTDIRLGSTVPEMGGLHVILTEYHDAGRIDRQLIGRCARQGDPGSYEIIAALDDPIVVEGGAATMRLLAKLLRRFPQPVIQALGRSVLRIAQRRVERAHGRMRQRLLRADDEQGNRLAFAGRSE